MGNIQCVRFCQVIDVSDNTDMDMIKVRISPDDDARTVKEIPYAFPLLPKMFHVKPKLYESVFVLLAVSDNAVSQRYYIGPVISQDHRLYYDKSDYATSFMRGTPYLPDVAPSTKKEMQGIMPKDEDIIIRGRKNADIQITDDDIRIKSGVKLVNEANKYDMHFNEHDPAFVKVKYHSGGLIKTEDMESNANGDMFDKQVNSTVTLVADKINLLSNQSNEKTYTPIDKDELITDADLKRALNECYKLPYGEKLVEILSMFIQAFVVHTHPFIMLPPVPAAGIPELMEKKATLLDNKGLLSDTVRFN